MKIIEALFRRNPALEKEARELSHFVFSPSGNGLEERETLTVGESVDIYNNQDGTNITLFVLSQNSATVVIKEGGSLVSHVWRIGEFTRRGFGEERRDIVGDVRFDENVALLTFPGGKIEIIAP